MSDVAPAPFRAGDPDAIARAAMALYPPAERGVPRLVCLSENATYRIDLPGGRRRVLRVHRPGYHDATEIRSELAWLDSLRAAGIQVPRAVCAMDGERLHHVSTPGASGRHVVMFEWIDGTEPTPDIDPGSFARLGRITARLHQHSRAWRRPQGFRRKVWTHATMVGSAAAWGQWQAAQGLDPRARDTITHAMAQAGSELAAYGDGGARFGLIHADLRLANLLIAGERTHIIDFDDCGFSWFMQDLAAALSFFEDHPRMPHWVAHWLRGYETMTPVERADLSILPALIAQRRVQLLAWATSHAHTAQVQALGPQWGTGCVTVCRDYLDGRLARRIGA
ncbi:phosphotransferase [Gluconacetobacter entanii]|uniref:phosphotransferase enzyme family protein n=1 Tax=Gluconacetobacter entanii TaxID=108528 RepID=UPI001C933D79|nr:phosphotransferase [Gluconacetobacter entanii]MBY4639083.1 phosphotransferase [Gluconacetobacter entanii]MCW4580728.1 phosphotransferase [Gluconacetobacter entanii]MCW4584057.1 phosphotransferase [Gluconacetobacter entanii]MCW4587350.1 phosphotransferase [Gluconacetobacter entanii]